MRPDLAKLTKLANRVTPSRMIMEAMGWRFTGIDVLPGPPGIGGLRLRGDFICACGREETFTTILDEWLVADATLGSPGAQAALLVILDPAKWLIEHGSTSVEHLRKDGYTAEQIAEIQDRGLQARRILGERTPMELDQSDYRRAAVRY